MTSEAGTVSADQAARLLMLTPHRVRQLVREGVLPKAARDRYPLVGLIQGYIQYLKDDQRNATRVAADRELKAARQAEIELRLAQKRRELISREAAEGAMFDLVGLINEEFGGFPARVTRDRGVRDHIDRELDATLNRIADRAQHNSEELAEGPSHDPRSRRR